MSSETNSESSPRGRRRTAPIASILIIDDEPAVGQSLRRTLERAGFAVTVTTSGAEGLAAFQHSTPDMVITDILMPRLHGIDVIRRLRESRPATLIIAISGGGNFGRLRYEPDALTTSAYLVAARQVGADAVLTKPFDREELLTCINTVLQARRASSSS